MLLTTTKLRRKARFAWKQLSIVFVVVVAAGWAALELGQRFLNVQKLVIEHINIVGCQWGRQSEVKKIAEELCKGKSLFLFDADQLQERINSLRWVRASLIRREPPDRLSIVIEERQPLFMIATAQAVLLMSEDGIIIDSVNQANLRPLPIVADPKSLNEETIIKLLQVARVLKAQQPDFYSRLVELKWGRQGTSSGPIVFMEGLQAPIFLSREEPAKNIPNFQAIYLREYTKNPDLGEIRYFDLCWDNRVVVGELPENAIPQLLKQ